MGMCYSSSTCNGTPLASYNTGGDESICLKNCFENFGKELEQFVFTNAAGGGKDDCFCYDTCTPVYDPTKPNWAVYSDPCPNIPYTQCVGAVCLQPTELTGPFQGTTSLQECVNECTTQDLDNRYAFFDPDAAEEEACTCAVNCGDLGSVASIQAAVQSAAIQYKYPDTECRDGCAEPIQVSGKASKTDLKPGQTVRYTLTLTPLAAAAWTDVDLVVTLSPHLTLQKTTVSPRPKPYIKSTQATGSGGSTVVTYDDLQRFKAKNLGNRPYRPVKVTVVARVSKTAPLGDIPDAITATLCSGQVASVDFTVFKPQK